MKHSRESAKFIIVQCIFFNSVLYTELSIACRYVGILQVLNIDIRNYSVHHIDEGTDSGMLGNLSRTGEKKKLWKRSEDKDQRFTLMTIFKKIILGETQKSFLTKMYKYHPLWDSKFLLQDLEGFQPFSRPIFSFSPVPLWVPCGLTPLPSLHPSHLLSCTSFLPSEFAKTLSHSVSSFLLRRVKHW